MLWLGKLTHVEFQDHITLFSILLNLTLNIQMYPRKNAKKFVHTQKDDFRWLSWVEVWDPCQLDSVVYEQPFIVLYK